MFYLIKIDIRFSLVLIIIHYNRFGIVEFIDLCPLNYLVVKNII